MRKVKSNSNITYDCQYHVVWCPKYRRKVLQYGVDVRLKEILQEVAIEKNAPILEMEIMPDHVQLLVSVNPQFGIHKLIKLMKGRSSRYLRLEFPLWTNSYFVATVGGATLDVVKRYIEEQKNH
jgi:putative transposase